MTTAVDTSVLIGVFGAHAASQCDRLLTRDRGYYKRYFAGLTVVDPSI